MTPGELLIDAGDHALNTGRRTITLVVRNTADRPIQVGSHYHFAETNGALGFDFQHQVGVGQPQAVAYGGAEHFGIGASGDGGHGVCFPIFLIAASAWLASAGGRFDSYS